MRGQVQRSKGPMPLSSFSFSVLPQVSPHEFLQAVLMASSKRFRIRRAVRPRGLPLLAAQHAARAPHRAPVSAVNAGASTALRGPTRGGGGRGRGRLPRSGGRGRGKGAATSIIHQCFQVPASISLPRLRTLGLRPAFPLHMPMPKQCADSKECEYHSTHSSLYSEGYNNKSSVHSINLDLFYTILFCGVSVAGRAGSGEGVHKAVGPQGGGGEGEEGRVGDKKKKGKKGKGGEAEEVVVVRREVSRLPFLMLGLDLPPPPLFKDVMRISSPRYTHRTPGHFRTPLCCVATACGDDVTSR